MPTSIQIDAFRNWAAFETELRAILATELDPQAVERVMARTLRSFQAIQLKKRTPQEELIADAVARREAWDQDGRATTMQSFLLLIRSFVMLERAGR